jgi:hypothetical protein
VDEEVCRQRILIFLVRVTRVVFSSIAADTFLPSATDWTAKVNVIAKVVRLR